MITLFGFSKDLSTKCLHCWTKAVQLYFEHLGNVRDSGRLVLVQRGPYLWVITKTARLYLSFILSFIQICSCLHWPKHFCGRLKKGPSVKHLQHNSFFFEKVVWEDCPPSPQSIWLRNNRCWQLDWQPAYVPFFITALRKQ